MSQAEKKTERQGPRACYLRETRIRLADGKEYSFRALPFTEETIEFVEFLMGSGSGRDSAVAGMMRMLKREIVISLSWAYELDQIREMFNSGLIPLAPAEAGSEETRIYQEILNALAYQMAGGGGAIDPRRSRKDTKGDKS